MYQKVERPVRLHVLKDSQHCYRIDGWDKGELRPREIFAKIPEMMEAKTEVWKMFMSSQTREPKM